MSRHDKEWVKPILISQSKRLLCAAFIVVSTSLSAQTVTTDSGTVQKFGNKAYEWGKMLPEQVEILKLSGDVERGKEAFRGCRGCHKADAGGLLDGTYPRLTGQHASVVIKQVTEVIREQVEQGASASTATAATVTQMGDRALKMIHPHVS